MQPSGSEVLKVPGIGKEGKYRSPLLGQPDLCLEFVGFHHGITQRVPTRDSLASILWGSVGDKSDSPDKSPGIFLRSDGTK